MAEKELPKYKCHKEVHALRIAQVLIDGATGEGIIVPGEEGFAEVRVLRDYMEKHQPQAGGYYIVYKDGYKSYSPALAFEEGYTSIAKLDWPKGD